jgi:hypothetical protein
LHAAVSEKDRGQIAVAHGLVAILERTFGNSVGTKTENSGMREHFQELVFRPREVMLLMVASFALSFIAALVVFAR